jgi:uncharacterized protein (TIGR02246 family)
MGVADLHRVVEEAFNAGDVDRLVGLYEPDATLVGEDGVAALGLDAIREAWAASISFGGKITLTTRHALEQGDLALLSNQWTFEMPGLVVSSITAEVARRQPDGSWRYVIDNPYAAPVPEAVT